MPLLLIILGYMILNVALFYIVTSKRVLGPYENPKAEFHTDLIPNDWVSVILMPLIDIFHCRRKHKVLVGSFSINVFCPVFSVYYDTDTKRFTLSTALDSKAYQNMEYTAAIAIINFWYADNAPLRHKYLRLIRLLKRENPTDFNDLVLKSDIINSSDPINGSSDINYNEETRPVL